MSECVVSDVFRNEPGLCRLRTESQDSLVTRESPPRGELCFALHCWQKRGSVDGGGDG